MPNQARGGSAGRWFQVRIVTEQGQTVEFVPTAVAPLPLEDILRSCSAVDRTLHLRFQAERARIDGATLSGGATLTAQIRFYEPLGIYALVRGGWLPPPFVLPPMFLVDRNFVGTLKHLRLGKGRQDSAELEWWVELLAGDRAWFNPLPCAMEGCERRTPTFEEFVDEYRAASVELTASFPEAKVVNFEQLHFEATYQLVTELARRSATEAAFLLETASLIVHPVAPQRLATVRKEILGLARKHRVAPGALVLIAVLSCLYGDEELAIGRRVLKLSADHTRADAHNALSDLQLIELLAASGELSEFGPFSLCTRDRGLALFWCAVSPSFGSRDEHGASITLTLDSRLFPRLPSSEFDKLITMLESNTSGVE